MKRTVAALGVLALVAAACSSSSEPKRPVAKAGQIVTVMSHRDGGLLDPFPKASLASYEVLAVAPGGDLYVGDGLNHRVLKVPRSGRVTTVLDCHTLFPEGMVQGKLGRRADCNRSAPGAFGMPWGVAVDNSGTLYVTDVDNAVWAVTPSGRGRKVVGSGRATVGIASPIVVGPPGQVDVVHPGPIAVDREGTLYFEDARRVVKLGRDAVVTLVAGDGSPRNFSGDGGPATQAAIDVGGLAVDGDGNVYIGASGRVRRVDRQGIITTVAGTGEEGDSGDGGPATKARFSSIRDIALDAEGNLFVAEYASHRVRRVDRNGVVTTVVGTGEEGDSGDGGPAVQARVNFVRAVATDKDGNLYLADIDAQRVRMVGGAAR